MWSHLYHEKVTLAIDRRVDWMEPQCIQGRQDGAYQTLDIGLLLGLEF